MLMIIERQFMETFLNNNIWIPLTGLGMLSAFSICCLWFMVAKPEQWGRLVDRENSFWVRNGLASERLTRWVVRFEKGRGQKILVGAGAVLNGAGFIVFSIGFWILYHR